MRNPKPRRWTMRRGPMSGAYASHTLHKVWTREDGSVAGVTDVTIREAWRTPRATITSLSPRGDGNVGIVLVSDRPLPHAEADATLSESVERWMSDNPLHTAGLSPVWTHSYLECEVPQAYRLTHSLARLVEWRNGFGGSQFLGYVLRSVENGSWQIVDSDTDIPYGKFSKLADVKRHLARKHTESPKTGRKRATRPLKPKLVRRSRTQRLMDAAPLGMTTTGHNIHKEGWDA